GGLGVMDLDEGPRAQLDERALGLRRLDLDRALERRLEDLLEQLAVLAEVDADDLDPDVALLLLALEAEPHGRLAARVDARLAAARTRVERERPLRQLERRDAGAGRRGCVVDRVGRRHVD